ncbi:MAG: cytochrome c [Flavobacteriales bacterium]|nr:cytochrome c [Flavobacteriales bacterium]
MTAPAFTDALKDPMADNPMAIDKGSKVFGLLVLDLSRDAWRWRRTQCYRPAKPPADLGSPQVQGQSTGALYWKITNGRGEMASYALVLSREDRWAVAHYLRTLAHE